MDMRSWKRPVLASALGIGFALVSPISPAAYAQVRETNLTSDEIQTTGIVTTRHRVTVGGKGLKEGIFELKWRTAKEVRKVAIAEAESAVAQAVREAAAKS